MLNKGLTGSHLAGIVTAVATVMAPFLEGNPDLTIDFLTTKVLADVGIGTAAAGNSYATSVIVNGLAWSRCLCCAHHSA